MPALTLVPPARHRHAPWRNGGGTTALLHLLRGAIEAGGATLGPGDTLRADGVGEGRLAVAASEESVAVVATIDPVLA